MDDLAHWLGKQLDEDERIARAVEDRSAPWDGQWMADGNSAVRTANGHVLFYRHGPAPLKPGLADHVAEWDPARVLREIEAKRRMLDEVLKYEAKIDGEWGCCHDPDEIAAGQCAETQPQDVTALRLLALPFADRPGFQESWRL